MDDSSALTRKFAFDLDAKSSDVTLGRSISVGLVVGRCTAEHTGTQAPP